MLVGVADDARPMARDDVPRRRTEVETVDQGEPGGRALEARDDPDEGRLAGAARPEDDAELAALDAEGQTAERRDAAVLGRVDDEDLAQVDERRHRPAPIRPGPRGSENARRVVQRTSTAAHTANTAPATSEHGGAHGRHERRLGRGRAGGHRDDARDEHASSTPPTIPPRTPTTATIVARAVDDAAEKARRRALGLEVDELAAVVPEVGADREDEAPDRQDERRQSCAPEGEERPVAERIAPRVLLERRAGALLEDGERPLRQRRRDPASLPSATASQSSFTGRHPAPACRPPSERAEVGDDGVARRPGQPLDDRADPDVDRLAADPKRERAADAAGERTERRRDDGDAADRRPWAGAVADGVALRRDRVETRRPGSPVERPAAVDAALADPPVERDAEDTEGRRPPERDPRVGAASSSRGAIELEADEPCRRARSRGSGARSTVGAVGVGRPELDARGSCRCAARRGRGS